MVLGAEFIPSGNFALNMGYNSQKRQELKVSTRPGLAGFSMGFSLRISKFRFGYGRTIYSLAGASNLFTVNMVFPDRKKS